MTDLIERYRRWLMNTGFDGGENSPPVCMIAAIQSRGEEIARLREALDDAITTMASIRAMAASSDWPESGSHIAELCRCSMTLARAALEKRA